MKQLAVILGIIFGILVIFGVVALVLYRLSKKNQKKTISTKPNQEEPEEDYPPQHHPQMNLDIFADDKKQGKKLNNADAVVDENDEEGSSNEDRQGTDQEVESPDVSKSMMNNASSNQPINRQRQVL